MRDNCALSIKNITFYHLIKHDFFEWCGCTSISIYRSDAKWPTWKLIHRILRISNFFWCVLSAHTRTLHSDINFQRIDMHSTKVVYNNVYAKRTKQFTWFLFIYNISPLTAHIDIVYRLTSVNEKKEIKLQKLWILFFIPYSTHTSRVCISGWRYWLFDNYILKIYTIDTCVVCNVYFVPCIPWSPTSSPRIHCWMQLQT